jgi:putative inorganic carbon (HCO3(-)) transporter
LPDSVCPCSLSWRWPCSARFGSRSTRKSWSIIASKYIVPFALFHIAMLVFRGASANEGTSRSSSLIALAYLVFIAIAFLLDARSLIFPRFILDESLGFHPDRARGPFLQAVANGVSLNILGILLSRSRPSAKIVVGLLWLVLPLAVLATMTRAVWISFAVSTIVLGFRMVERRLQALMHPVSHRWPAGWPAIGLSNHSLKAALWDRTGERGPVEARLAVYDAGWAMFQERPLTGWPARSMYAELARRMAGYHLSAYYVHNTYLALLVEFGVPGLGPLRHPLLQPLPPLVARPARRVRAIASLRRVWPILLGVYLFNAFFVDMAYQFVIGLMFTVAGMLCAPQESVA